MILEIIAVVASLGTLLGGIAAFITAVRKIGRKVDDVHRLVNQQHTDLKNYQAALIRALNAHGITIPIDQSAPQPQADR